MSQIKKGAILSYLNLGITNIVGILMTPFIIKMLGKQEYGLFQLIGAFVGYLSILDLGLNNSIVRFVAQYRAQNDEKGLKNFLAISLIIYTFIGLLLALIGGAMYFNLETLFGESLDVTQFGKAKTMFLILILNIAVTLPGGAFTAICSGYEKFVFPKILSIVKYLTRSIMVVVILFRGADAVDMVILDTVLNFLMIATSFIYVRTKLNVKPKLYHFDKEFVKEIFGYSIWIFIFGLVYQFQWRTGQTILGSTMDTTTVAVFSIGVMLGLYFSMFGNVINGLILPRAVNSIYKNNDNSVLTQEMIKIARVSLLLLFYIFGGFVVLGKQFIFLWVGKGFEQAWLVGLLIMLAYIIPISQGYAHAILEAKKKMRFKSLTSLTLSAVGIVIGGVLSKTYGVYGMIYGIFIALMLLQLVIVFYYHYKIELDMKRYFLEALIPYLILFFVTFVISNYLVSFFQEGWLNFMIKGTIYTVIFGLGSNFLLKKNEKQLFLGYLKK